MTRPSERPIRKAAPSITREVRLPPSKSYTNRALAAAALASGRSTILRPSRSQDSHYMTGALASFGVRIDPGPVEATVEGTDGILAAPRKPIFVGNAGTTFRFLTALAAIATGTTTLTGDDQMRARPVGDLLAALAQAGVRSTSAGGFPPVTVEGGSFSGGAITLPGDKSSQYLSAILLAAPYASAPVTVTVEGAQSSAPYIGMTTGVMRAFGVSVEEGPGPVYRIGTGARYKGRTYAIEPDASAASYFLAAAAVTGGRVRIPGLSSASLQGDVRFLDTLVAMGCTATPCDDALEIAGGSLHGVDVDMNAMPDCVPTLAVLALFAEGQTTIRNVAHLRYKETDRLAALSAELTRLGARVDALPDGLVIRPAPLTGARIETYRDHRIAMSFALAGLRVPGVSIADPGCVAKSFPGFWDEFTHLESTE